MVEKFGYLASDIRYGLWNLPIPTHIIPSESKIRKYAKKHNLVIQIGRGIHKSYIVPGSRLEELLNGLEIPVRCNDLVESMDRSYSDE